MSSFSHCFCHKLTAREQRIVERVAEAHGSCLVYVGPGGIPGNHLAGWIEGPNLGFPCDRDREAAITEDLGAAGISLSLAD